MKNKLKLLISLLLIFVMLFTLISCGKEVSAKATTENFLKALKKGDKDTISGFYLGDSSEVDLINQVLDILKDSETLSSISDMVSEAVLDFQYEINDVVEDGDTAKANVTLIVEDWETVITNSSVLISTKLLTMILDGTSEKQMEKEFKAILEEQREKAEDLEYEFNIDLVKVDGEWKVDVSDEVEALISSITGGLTL